MKVATSDGIEYCIDEIGVIHQLNPQPFTYDAKYCSTYDTEAYRRESDKLMALRYGFTVACHGRVPKDILDFGSGNNAFVNFAKQQCKAVGYDIAPGPDKITELRPAEVYTFWDALEHVPDIDSMIDSLDCETIVMSLPCCKFATLGIEWFNTWKHRKPNEHLHHFDLRSLTKFMLMHGYAKTASCNQEDIIRKSTDGLINIITAGFRKI